jgi:ligand-binding SRPBCC domain-containing protein
MPSGQAALVQLNLVPLCIPADRVPADAGHMAGAGTEIVFKFKAIPYLPMHERWTALITEFSANEYFCDVQKQGPFRSWHHRHSFEAKAIHGRDGTIVLDLVEYEVGFGVMGRMLETLLFQRMLRKTCEYRKIALAAIFWPKLPSRTLRRRFHILTLPSARVTLVCERGHSPAFRAPLGWG